MNEQTELTDALYNLAKILSENQEDEATAVKGYTIQLKAISEARRAAEEDGGDNTEMLALLDKFYSATEEKISDELNHQSGLLEEYVQLTGIKIAAS